MKVERDVLVKALVSSMGERAIDLRIATFNDLIGFFDLQVVDLFEQLQFSTEEHDIFCEIFRISQYMQKR